MPSDQSVSSFRNARNTCHVPIRPQREFCPTDCECAKYRFGSGEDVSCRVHQMHGTFQVGPRNLRQLHRHVLILERHIFHLFAGRLFPAFNPRTAEAAIAVVNHDRIRWWLGDAQRWILVVLSSCADPGEPRGVSPRMGRGWRTVDLNDGIPMADRPIRGLTPRLAWICCWVSGIARASA